MACGSFNMFYLNNKNMQIEKQLAIKIAKNAVLSLFIYALPILLMLGWFYIRGEKPWQQSNKQNSENILHK